MSHENHQYNPALSFFPVEEQQEIAAASPRVLAQEIIEDPRVSAKLYHELWRSEKTGCIAEITRQAQIDCYDEMLVKGMMVCGSFLATQGEYTYAACRDYIDSTLQQVAKGSQETLSEKVAADMQSDLFYVRCLIMEAIHESYKKYSAKHN